MLIEAATPIEISNGIEFSAELEAALGWTGKAPFPSWILPDEGSLAAKFSLSPYVAAKMEAWEDAEAKLSGEISVGVQILPTLKVDSVKGSVSLSAEWKSWTMAKTWSVDFYGGSMLDVLSMFPQGDELEGIEWVYYPQGAVGTGRIYGANSVIADVSGDLWQDSPADLAVGPDGRILAAWAKAGDPYAQVGDDFVVAEFDGTAWTTPVVLPGSFGINRNVKTIVDNLGRRIVVWSMADRSLLGAGSSSDEIMAARKATDVYYALCERDVWSLPQPVARTEGADACVETFVTSDGDLWVAWVSQSSEDTYQLLATRLDGNAFGTPIVVATGRNLGEIAISELDGLPVIFWTVETDSCQPPGSRTLCFSTSTGEGWTAPRPFEPQLLDSPGEGSTTASLVNPSLEASSLFGIPVPEKCCKCEKWDTEYHGIDEGCGFTTTIDAEKCKKIITYKPCVPPPVDPNEIVGPVGQGEEHWISADRQLDYMIRFENDPVFAQAPAQKVVITQQLDADLNNSTKKRKWFMRRLLEGIWKSRWRTFSCLQSIETSVRSIPRSFGSDDCG